MTWLFRRFRGKFRMTGINHLPKINDPKNLCGKGLSGEHLPQGFPLPALLHKSREGFIL